jgi:hypothetical protein
LIDQQCKMLWKIWLVWKEIEVFPLNINEIHFVCFLIYQNRMLSIDQNGTMRWNSWSLDFLSCFNDSKIPSIYFLRIDWWHLNQYWWISSVDIRLSFFSVYRKGQREIFIVTISKQYYNHQGEKSWFRDCIDSTVIPRLQNQLFPPW